MLTQGFKLHRIRIDRLELHPFFFALWPIALHANLDRGWTFSEEIVVPVLVLLVFAGLLFCCFKATVGDQAKAALLSSISIIWLFSYSDFRSAVRFMSTTLSVDCWPDPFVIISFLGLLPMILFIAINAQGLSPATSKALNLVSVALVFFNCAVYWISDLQTFPERMRIAEREGKRDRYIPNIQVKRPDIYFIVYDALGRGDGLRKAITYEDRKFLHELEKLGMNVCSKSIANYEWTFASLAATLNMDYLWSLCPEPVSNEQQTKVLGSMIRNNRVARILSKAGYRTFNYCSGSGVTDWNPEVSVNIPSGIGDQFLVRLIDSSALSILPPEINLANALARTKRTAIIKEIDRVLQCPDPKFVFIHIDLPHAPYLFNNDGSPCCKEDLMGMSPSEYSNQAQYAQKHMLVLLGRILSDNADKIVVVEGDHGPHFTGSGHSRNEHVFCMPIFNAYYLPDSGDKLLYQSISPVNSFRLILNHYFGLDYAQLPNKHYHSNVGSQLTCQDIADEIQDGDVIDPPKTNYE